MALVLPHSVDSLAFRHEIIVGCHTEITTKPADSTDFAARKGKCGAYLISIPLPTTAQQHLTPYHHRHFRTE